MSWANKPGGDPEVGRQRSTSYNNHAYEGRRGGRHRREEYDEEYDVDEERAPSERTASEYMVVANERIASPNHQSSAVPEIFVTDYSSPYTKRPPSEFSHYSGRTYRSGASTSTTARKRTSRQGGVVVETMSAPNPFCPNTRGACCLMLLLNLGLILLTLGFVIVLQLFKPPFVWYLGIVFLVVGFLTLMGSIVYWVHLCRQPPPPQPPPIYPYPYTYYDPAAPADANGQQLYWTRHWQKRIQLPEVHRNSSTQMEGDKMSDRYSDRSAKSAASNKSDRKQQHISAYSHH